MTWTAPATPTGGTAITVSFWNTNARDNLTHLRNFLPDGGTSGQVLVNAGSNSATWQSVFSASMVMMWKASAGSVPSGWTVDTDFNDRFPVGAGGTYALDATGGASTVNLQHSHAFTSGGPSATVSIDHPGGAPDDTPASSGHTHGGSTDPNLSTTQSVLNPYRAIYFIRKT